MDYYFEILISALEFGFEIANFFLCDRLFWLHFGFGYMEMPLKDGRLGSYGYLFLRISISLKFLVEYYRFSQLLVLQIDLWTHIGSES